MRTMMRRRRRAVRRVRPSSRRVRRFKSVRRLTPGRVGYRL